MINMSCDYHLINNLELSRQSGGGGGGGVREGSGRGLVSERGMREGGGKG